MKKRRINEIIFSIAQRNANSFPVLYEFINWDKIYEYCHNKLDKTGEKKEVPFNLLEALLMESCEFPGVYTTHSNLRNLEFCLKKVLPYLTEENKKELKNRLSNLGNTSFWDTATELWFSVDFLDSGYKLKFDFPLRKMKKGFTPPNADVAFLDQNQNPVWLFDCITPTLELDICKGLKLDNNQFIPEPEKAIDCVSAIVKKKFENKFLQNLDSYPNANYGILLCLTKAEEITAHLFDLNLRGKTPVIIDSRKYDFHPKLKRAIAGRFQEKENKKDIEFVNLVYHNVV